MLISLVYSFKIFALCNLLKTTNKIKHHLHKINRLCTQYNNYYWRRPQIICGPVMKMNLQTRNHNGGIKRVHRPNEIYIPLTKIPFDDFRNYKPTRASVQYLCNVNWLHKLKKKTSPKHKHELTHKHSRDWL